MGATYIFQKALILPYEVGDADTMYVLPVHPPLDTNKQVPELHHVCVELWQIDEVQGEHITEGRVVIDVEGDDIAEKAHVEEQDEDELDETEEVFLGLTEVIDDHDCVAIEVDEQVHDMRDVVEQPELQAMVGVIEVRVYLQTVVLQIVVEVDEVTQTTEGFILEMVLDDLWRYVINQIEVADLRMLHEVTAVTLVIDIVYISLLQMEHLQQLTKK